MKKKLNFCIEKCIFEKKIVKICQHLGKQFVENLQKIEDEGREKNANLVDLEKCCKMRFCSLS